MELLNIAMSAAQVKEACADWARKRTTYTGTEYQAHVGIEKDFSAVVAFTKKRVYKTKEKA